jgi:AbrB family looped-hinge helix DNA binding protein
MGLAFSVLFEERRRTMPTTESWRSRRWSSWDQPGMILTRGKDMPTATITSKGQITLPKEVREHLHVAEGDRVEFVIGAGGQVEVRSLTGSFRDLHGLCHRPGLRAPTIEELEELLVAAVAEDDRRIREGRE